MVAATKQSNAPVSRGHKATPSTPFDPINVIIPIGGIGSRFSKEGYRFPKPLINIVGRPLILKLIDHLSLKPGDTLWMAINEEVDNMFRIGQLVSKTFPNIDFRLLRLRHQTRGASETLYMVSQSMTEAELSRKTASLDCDTLYWVDVLDSIRAIPRGHGGCFYFPDEGGKPIFSYLKCQEEDGAGLIVDIQEKKAISNKANTGAYVFPSAGQLRDWAAEALDHGRQVDQVGELYTSSLIALMIHNGVPFLGIKLSTQDFSCVGTPEQLQSLLRQLKSGNGNHVPIKLQHRRFCFDLDMTLVGVPLVPGDYTTCPPIEKNIKLVQQLHRAGHYIIIQTARRMKTHSGNIGSVLADVGPLTFDQLAKYSIPYHEVHFGKPHADVYVDDLAVNSNLDTMREIGWALDEVTNDAATDGVDDQGAIRAGMIPARDFNTIQIIGDKVIKSSTSEDILGELFFYAHTPRDSELARIFPAVYNVDFTPDTHTYSIVMEKRRGLTFSHMLVGRSITKGRLLSLLRALHTVHSTTDWDSGSGPAMQVSPALAAKFDAHSPAPARAGGGPPHHHHQQQVNMYANYGTKLRSRYKAHRARYDALGPLAATLFGRLNDFLDTYEAEDRGLRAQVIHGDPVFSNAILGPDDGLVSFIDVRCRQERALTPEGDINYDLAKVLQSLCGYDHVLFMAADSGSSGRRITDEGEGAGELLDQADRRLLEELREHFFCFLEGTYSVRLHRKTLLRITASLFFSLIPLHRPELGPVFLRLCKETLDKAASCSSATTTTTNASTIRQANSRAVSLNGMAMASVEVSTTNGYGKPADSSASPGVPSMQSQSLAAAQV